MAIQHGTTHTWRKSSYSGGNGACVEVRSPVPDALAVRDSKEPAGPRLGFTTDSWSRFVAAVGDGGRLGRL
ncbi:DUF397 domain-containing protein [Streptomyces otsuchiensis]|uniref:DUF397 domain-containing protein n=1 Tax=Streptomyces otsuchiensis TaxID=2681388 RepID=UPI00103183A2|nr:DUF397 domain-containing protein [Streptomyces otsuchiensis]